MSEQNRVPKIQKPKRVRFIRGLLRCLRCGQYWTVADLNEELKIVKCPICATPNDIRGAKERGAE